MCWRIVGLVLIGASLQGVQPKLAFAGEDCSDVFGKLFSPDVNTSREAFKRVRATRDKQTAEVMRRLAQKATWEDRACEGLADAVCAVAGLYRMEDCAKALAKHIGFTLDPKTFPWMRFATSAYYPVARALARIGGRAALDAIVPLLTKETGELRLRECIWIARECLGREGAKAWISATVEDRELRTALLQWAAEIVILASVRK